MRLKPIIALGFAVLMITLSGTRAQSQDRPAYAKGDVILNTGISFGYYSYGYLGSRTIGLPPLSASLEVGVHELLSVGGFAGIASWGYDYRLSGTNYKYRWTFTSFGGRGSFHYVPLLNEHFDMGLDENAFDFYVSLLLGVQIQSYSSNRDISGVNYSSGLGGIFAPVLGWKYMFNNNIGIYLEGGRGVFGWGTIGASFKF